MRKCTCEHSDYYFKKGGMRTIATTLMVGVRVGKVYSLSACGSGYICGKEKQKDESMNSDSYTL